MGEQENTITQTEQIMPKEKSKLLIGILIGLVAIIIIGLGIYFLAFSGNSDSVNNSQESTINQNIQVQSLDNSVNNSEATNTTQIITPPEVVINEENNIPEEVNPEVISPEDYLSRFGPDYNPPAI
jgi:flagellar basal body-associated protein FliL